MRRSLVATAAVLATVVIASGCNSKLLRPPAIIFADSGEFAVRTSIREEGARYPSVFTAFVPSQVPLHPGDAVNFQLRDTGEPHTVALGTLIDTAVAAVDGLGPSATLKQVEKLSAMKKVPSVLPASVPGGDAPVELNAAASERCFLDEGGPIKGERCEEADQPDFSGEQSFFSSGLLEEGEPFRIKLAADAKPGTYRFMCLVHRSAMTGSIEIRSKDTARPAVAELRTQAEAEENEIASSLEPAARIAGVKAFDRKPQGPVAAGTGPRGISRAFVAAFIGNEITAPVNTTVRWNLHRMHSISFRPSRQAKEGLIIEEEDGFALNEDAWSAVGSRPVPAAISAFPPSSDKPVRIEGGTWDGEGSWSSGVIRATPPRPVAYVMRFSKAGTYAYSCLVHPSMRGKVAIE